MARDIVLTIVGRDRASEVFDKVAASASRSARTMDRVNASITAAGARLTHSVTVPVVAAAAASVKFATDFQAAMTRIHTQAGGSARDVQVLSKQVLDLSKTTQQGPVQLADALYHLKSVGMDNVNAMKALAVSSKLAAVGHANLEQATNALAGAWRTGIKGAQNFGQAAATVNAIIGAGNMRMDDFTAAIGTGILPAAKTFGLSLKQVGAALALMTDEGVPAVDAATRLRMTFALIGAPSKVATKWLGDIHLKALDLATAMRHPNTGLIDAVTMLKDHLEKFGGSAAKQSMILARAFGGGRSSATIMSLINNLDVLRRKQQQVNDTVGKFGSAVAAQGQTAQAKFAILVSNLQRVAVEVGNQVLPYVTRLVQKVGDAVTWFGNLSSSTQGSIVKFALIAAAVGPVLSILGRLTRLLTLVGKGWYLLVSGADAAVMSAARLVAGMRMAEISIEGMSTRSYAAGLRLRNMFQSLGSKGIASLKLLGSAAAGGAIGYGLGQLSKHADTTTKVLDTLGSTAAGAAVGLATGGPLGAAVGGIAGLVGSLAANFLGVGKSANDGAKQAAAAMARQKADAQDLRGVLESVNGAYSAQYRQSIVQKLNKSGALDILSQLGMNNPTTISTILGQNGAKGWADLTASIENATAAGQINFKQMDLLLGVIQHLSPAAAQAEHSFELENAALGKGVLSSNQLSVSYKNLRNVFKNTGTTLDDVTAAGQHNRAAITQIAQATNSATIRAIEHGKAVQDTSERYNGQYFELKLNLAALGFQGKAVDSLITKYRMTPKQIVTKLVADADQGFGTAREFQNIIDAIRQHKVPGLNANSGQGQAIVADLQRRIDLLTGKTVDINVNTHYNTYGVPSKTGGTAHFATGGQVFGPGTGTSDSILARLSNGEFVVRAAQARKHLELLNAINSGARGFASGGTVDNRAKSYTGGAPVTVVNNYYINGAMDPNAVAVAVERRQAARRA